MSMRAHLHATTLVGALAACASSPPAEPPPSPLPAPSPSVRPHTDALLPFARIERIEIADVACRYPSRVVFSDAPLALCFDGGDACWGELIDEPARTTELVLEARDPGRALVYVEYGGMRLAGFVRIRELLLFPTRLFSLAGFFIPQRLRVVGGEHGRAVLEVLPDASVTPAAPLREARACEDVSPYSDWFSPDEIAAFAIGKPRGEWRVLSAGHVPLSVAPRGATAATLMSQGGDSDDLVEAFDREGDRTRILVPRDAGSVFGWVPTKALRALLHEPGSVSGSSGGGHAWLVGPDPSRGQVCPESVRLFARVGDRVAEVGVAQANQPLTLGAIEGALIHVALSHSVARRDQPKPETKVVEGLRIVRGAELLARLADVERCVTTR